MAYGLMLQELGKCYFTVPARISVCMITARLEHVDLKALNVIASRLVRQHLFVV